MDLDSLIATLEAIAPPELARPIDQSRIGLVSRGKEEIDKIAVALDPTTHVIKEALRVNADVLITHHTLIWDPITRISPRIRDELRLILSDDLSYYVLHTNYDAAPGGVNDILARLLGLEDIEPFGMGRMGVIEPTSAMEFAQHVSRELTTNVQFIGNGIVRKVAVIGGSGFYSTEDAVEAGADALVSAELKHDIVRYARGRISLIDATHYATEAPAMKVLARRLNAVFIDDPPGFVILPP